MYSKMLPAELIVRIMRNCDLRTKTQFLLVNKALHWEAKRLLKPRVVLKGSLKREILGEEGDIQIVTAYKNNNLAHNYKFKLTYYNEKGQRHREKAPTVTYWYPTGQKKSEFWFTNDILHKEDGPAETHWHLNGNKLRECWFLHNKLHRKEFGVGSGPAFTFWYPSGGLWFERWYKNGIRHRENFPAVTLWRGGEKVHDYWYENDILIKEEKYKEDCE